MGYDEIGILSYILLTLIVLVLSIVIKNTNKLMKEIPNLISEQKLLNEKLVTEQKILNEKLSNIIDKINEIQAINDYKLTQSELRFDKIEKKIEKILN